MHTWCAYFLSLPITKTVSVKSVSKSTYMKMDRDDYVNADFLNFCTSCTPLYHIEKVHDHVILLSRRAYFAVTVCLLAIGILQWQKTNAETIKRTTEILCSTLCLIICNSNLNLT